MKIGILSDSHDHLVHVRQAVRYFQQAGVDLVVHAGDMVSPAIVRAMAGLSVVAALGNNDGEVIGLMRAFEKIGGRLEGDFLEVDLEIGRLAVYHGTVPAIRDALAGRGCYRLLVCGHTHRVEDRAEGATRILNPGSAHGFGKEPTVMIYDSVTDAAHLIRLHEPQPGCVL